MSKNVIHKFKKLRFERFIDLISYISFVCHKYLNFSGNHSTASASDGLLPTSFKGRVGWTEIVKNIRHNLVTFADDDEEGVIKKMVVLKVHKNGSTYYIDEAVLHERK